MQFVSHLQSFRRPLATLSQADMGLSASDIHPAIGNIYMRDERGKGGRRNKVIEREGREKKQSDREREENETK